MTDTRSIWMYRPFSRVVMGWKAYKIVVAYIKLNEAKASGKIPYKKTTAEGFIFSRSGITLAETIQFGWPSLENSE